MKKKDLQKKSVDELLSHVLTLREQLATMQRDKYLSDERNNSKKKNIRREIARSLTIINASNHKLPNKKSVEDKTKENK